ncbi:hypothetical protein BW99_09570 [Escherichia coli O157:H7 str. 08-3527]|uniref:Uncharacterized protein n=2 Tax=Traversvirus TaxID=1981157 RepID=Q7Y2Q6_9CAUD|nr:hypothetical protein Stx1_p076 [Escherichia Stx1 converting phage]NP_859320.1 hypothetical protein Stx2II_p075 [Escherichia phage Stx2 II]EYV63373.1 hypothetical protein BX36_12365 [Escherichia coli O157:H7 str. 2009EL2109]EYV85970.1 hypothetical protein BY51_25815 [Escherichia coli O157:H7 str. F7350]EYW87097.1 hypothetical protein BY19_00325 [Escherichia coli O157:H7 str. 2011EL-2099]EYW97343.1 hypothetical protein BX01_12485 [Escherichia coli O157:H7 str. 08-4169]EYX04198.1 hypothetical
MPRDVSRPLHSPVTFPVKLHGNKNGCFGIRHSLTTTYPTIRSYRRVARQRILQPFQLNVFLNPVSVARLKPLLSLLRISVKGTSATVIKLHFVEVSNLFKLRVWQLVSLAYEFGFQFCYALL